MSDDTRARFRDFVELNMAAHRIFTEAAERSLIGDGISRFDLDGEQARGVVASVVRQSDQMLESEISRNMLNIMHELAGKRGALSKRRFEQAVAILKALVRGQVTDERARSWLKRLVEESDLTVRGSGFFRRKRWFRRIKMVA
jgi:hypothetical protein